MTPLRRTPSPISDRRLLGAPVKRYPNRNGNQGDVPESDGIALPPSSDAFALSCSPQPRGSVSQPTQVPRPTSTLGGSGYISMGTWVGPAGGGGFRRKQMSKAPRARMSSVGKDALIAKNLIEAYKLRAKRLESRERSLLAQLALKREAIKDTKVEAESAQTALVKAEETISELEASLKEYQRRADRHQRWWLAENRSLKVIAEALPPSAARNLRHIVSSSQARYAIYCTDSV